MTPKIAKVPSIFLTVFSNRYQCPFLITVEALISNHVQKFEKSGCNYTWPQLFKGWIALSSRKRSLFCHYLSALNYWDLVD